MTHLKEQSLSRQQAWPVGHLGPPVKQLSGAPGGRAHTGVGLSTGQSISWAAKQIQILHIAYCKRSCVTSVTLPKGGGKRGHKCCVRDTKMFLIFVRNIFCPQQMFPRFRGMDTKQMFCVPLVCPPKKHHEQQCVRNNVSSFATTLSHFSNVKNCFQTEKMKIITEYYSRTTFR